MRTILVIVNFLVSLASGIRHSDSVINGMQKAGCTFKARVSSTEDFDFRSLVFDSPDFTFFQSQEFFVSDNATCEPLQGMELERVGVSIDAKRALLRQRFHVKQLKDGVQAALKMDRAYMKQLEKDRNLLKDAYHVPPVELHMFPVDPSNPASTWRVLMIPRAREVFGRTLFLCHEDRKCIAELPIEGLPLRLWKKWDPILDRSRSADHSLVLALEVFLALSLLAFLASAWQIMLAFRRKLRWEDSERSAADVSKDMLEIKMPQAFVLTRHAYLFQDASVSSQTDEIPLEAGTEVEIQQMQLGSRSLWWHALRTCDWRELVRIAVGKPGVAVWGLVRTPGASKVLAWIVAYDEVMGVQRIKPLGERSAPRYVAHGSFLPPLPVVFRETVVLVGSYLSAMWFLVEQMAFAFSKQNFYLLGIGAFIIHLLVLMQRRDSFEQGVEYEEILETKSWLLRPSQTDQVQMLFWPFFAFLCLVLTGASLCQATSLAAFSTFVAKAFVYVIFLALHAWRKLKALEGPRMWREPEIKPGELLVLVGEQLPTTTQRPETLQQSLAIRWFLSQSLVALSSFSGLLVMVLVLCDVNHIRGEVTEYSWSRGQLAYPSSHQGFHNTLLLDANVDSLILSVAPGDHTHTLCGKVQHPLLANKTDELPCQGNGRVEYEVALPPGPLYSSVTLEATGAFESNVYVIHILRLGVVMNLSLSSNFSQDRQAVFHEERRLRYQLQHPEWHVPEIDMQERSLVELRMRPVIFAPLSPKPTTSQVPQILDTCECGPPMHGFGNGCEVQEVVTLSIGSMCITSLRAAPLINVHRGQAGIAGMDSEVVRWLQNVSVSGKFVGLVSVAEEVHGGPPGDMFHFHPQNMSGYTIERTFSSSIPTASLALRGTHLTIASTEDMTDAEVLTVPITIVSHAPPVSLTIQKVADAYFLPPFDPEDLQPVYALCGPDASPENLQAATDDSRFHAFVSPQSGDLSCRKLKASVRDIRLIIRVRRRVSQSCMPWCEWYRPRLKDYDLMVIVSTTVCLQQAMQLDNITALVKISEEETDFIEHPANALKGPL